MRVTVTARGFAISLLLSAIQGLGSAEPAPDPQSASQLDQKVLAELDTLLASREFDRAEGVLDRLLRGGADPAVAYFQMGKLYFDHQQWARSAQHLERSLRLRDRNDQAHLLLGLDWRELRKPERAEEELAKAAAQNPSSDVDAYFAGHQLVLDAKYEAALPYLYRALDLNPKRPEALRAVAIAQAHVGNYGLAESYYRKALDAAGSSGQADYADALDLGYLLLLGHDPAKIREGFKYAQQAVQLQPASGDAHYLLGKALVKLGRLREAIPELRKAEALNPKDSKPHFLLARIFDRIGQREDAKKEREALSAARRRTGRSGIATGSALPGEPE